jgi:hypothetical protein
MVQIVSQDGAIQAAEQTLREMETAGCVPLAITHTMSFEDGWLFFYNSVEYLRSGNDLSRLAGNGPIFVQTSGAVHKLPTHQPYDVSLAALRSPCSPSPQ